MRCILIAVSSTLSKRKMMLIHPLKKIVCSMRMFLVSCTEINVMFIYRVLKHLPPLAPDIVKFPEETHVVEGEGVLFEVKVTGTPMPKLTWYHNGEEVSADYSRELEDDGTLTLPSAETKHSGMYKLVAQNHVGRREKEVQLFVKEENTQDEVAPAKPATTFSAIPVGFFGSHVERNHSKNNQGFINEYEVMCCVYQSTSAEIMIYIVFSPSVIVLINPLL